MGKRTEKDWLSFQFYLYCRLWWEKKHLLRVGFQFLSTNFINPDIHVYTVRESCSIRRDKYSEERAHLDDKYMYIVLMEFQVYSASWFVFSFDFCRSLYPLTICTWTTNSDQSMYLAYLESLYMYLHSW